MTISTRPTRAKIDLGAIVSNYRLLKEFAGRGEVYAVVKADAYGHGAGPVARVLNGAGCGRFAVSSLDEGVELRELGATGEVVALFGVDPSLSALAAKHAVTPVVCSLAMLKGCGEAAVSGGFSLPVHLNFDTGMSRMGILPGQTGEAVEILRAYPNLAVSGVATHFARAGESCDFTRVQIERFNGVIQALKASGVPTGIVHAANSAALLSEPDAHYDGARAGIALYGAVPEAGLPGADRLKPALAWSTEIALVREVDAGTPLSYGGSFSTTRRSRIATLPVGYADGYRRALSNGTGAVLVRGARAPVVGRICMDVTLVDVTDIPGAAAGDEAVLLGAQGDERISAEEIAASLGTINYEVFCSIGKRVPRIYNGG